jgi:SAM-dependent methyltransferase
MDSQQIREHWKNWATTYGGDLRATTKSRTAKALELDALKRRFRNILDASSVERVLEVGCGNGINCIELAKVYPALHFDGVDLIPEMIAAAGDNSRASGVGPLTRFFAGGVLELEELQFLKQTYDIVFTVRCLINLNAAALQTQALATLASKVRAGGYLLMIENSTTTYGWQNQCREIVGLEPRAPAEFNVFFDESVILPHLATIGLELIEIEDFSSLHDIVLYVLLPSINNGQIDYEHPLVQSAAALSAGVFERQPGAFGKFGQNRLYVCHKPV